MGSMRSIAAAQEQFRKGNIVDQDADGLGEFGWLGELAGTDPCRVIRLKMSNSPFVAAILGIKDKHGNARKSGFYYRMYLQGPDGRWTGEPCLADAQFPELADLPEAFHSAEKAADFNEQRWICYAWPNSHTHSGDEVFVVNEQGDVWVVQYEAGVGDGGPYTGAIHRPQPLAAFSRDGSRIADGSKQERGQDGRLWMKR